jgi:hypothetical protein
MAQAKAKQAKATTKQAAPAAANVNAPQAAPKQAAPAWLAKAQAAAAKAAPTLGKAPANGMAAMVQAIVNAPLPTATAGGRVNHVVSAVAGLQANAPAGTVALQVAGQAVAGTARLAHLQGAGAAKNVPSGMYALTTKGAQGKASGCSANQALTQALQQACANGPISGAALLAAMGGTSAAAAHIAYRVKGGWLQKG